MTNKKKQTKGKGKKYPFRVKHLNKGFSVVEQVLWDREKQQRRKDAKETN